MVGHIMVNKGFGIKQTCIHIWALSFVNLVTLGNHFLSSNVPTYKINNIYAFDELLEAVID